MVYVSLVDASVRGSAKNITLTYPTNWPCVFWQFSQPQDVIAWRFFVTLWHFFARLWHFTFKILTIFWHRFRCTMVHMFLFFVFKPFLLLTMLFSLLCCLFAFLPFLSVADPLFCIFYFLSISIYFWCTQIFVIIVLFQLWLLSPLPYHFLTLHWNLIYYYFGYFRSFVLIPYSSFL